MYRGGPTLQEREDGDNTRWADVDGQFVLPHRELLDVLGQAAHQPRAVPVQVVGLGLVLVGRVDDRRLQGAAKGSTLSCAHILDIGRQADGIGSGASSSREASRSSSTFTPGSLDGCSCGSESLS